MIQSLDDIIKECNSVALIDGKICYEEKLPDSSEDVNAMNNHYVNMRYCEGLVLKEEHCNYSSNELGYQLYEKYIFNDEDVFSDKFEINKDDIEHIINFRMLISQESPHLERFNLLMIRIYFEYREKRLTGLVQNILQSKEYDWVRNYIQSHPEEQHCLIFQRKTTEYNKLYGLKEEVDDTKENALSDWKTESISDVKDWISLKYGGEYFG